MALIAPTTAPFSPKSRDRLYMRCQSTSGREASSPSNNGRKAAVIAAAAISGGCRPWHSASPHPDRPSSVTISTIVAARCSTNPCENANGSSSALRSDQVLMSAIFIVQRLAPLRGSRKHGSLSEAPMSRSPISPESCARASATKVSASRAGFGATSKVRIPAGRPCRANLSGGNEMRKVVYPLACAIALVVLATELTAASAEAASTKRDADLDRGRYLVKIAGCNDCHTPNYPETAGAVPEKDWLTGVPVGFQGPWGTTYAANLRLVFAGMTEAQWMKGARH